MMRFFKIGGFLYGSVYLIWRGWLSLKCILPTWFYKRILYKCGQGTVFGNNVYVSYPRNISVGSGCNIGQNVIFNSERAEGKLIIGNKVQISANVVIDYTGDIIIEENVLISSGSRVITHDHGYNPRSNPTYQKLIVGKNAWIGLNAVILPSTKIIGKYSIIGIGSIVTTPVPDFAIMAGNPAKVIKFRDDISFPTP